MGQGGACNRCSDVNKASTSAVKALDEVSSEEEDAGEASEGSDEDEGAEEEAQEEEKRAAELSLQDTLKRGKTSTFKEAIDHAAALGIEEEKIQLAEKKLEDHKAFRRREAFEAELHDFLRTEEANDIANCEEKLTQGKEYGVSEKSLKALQDRILELELMKELNKDEIEQAKMFLELCTRRFVASCVAKGRDLQWIDLESGTKHKVVAKMDLTLKNFTVAGRPDGDISCKVDEVTAKRAVDAQEVSQKKGFSKLADADRENSVAVVLQSGSGPWCFLEASRPKQDEFIVAFQVFNGLMPAPAGSSTKTKASSPKGSPKGEAEDGEKSNLREAAEGEDDAGTNNPISPSIPEKKEKKSAGKSKRKSEKDKEAKEEDKPPEEKPPPPPPPLEEEENEGAAEEAEEE